MIQRFTGTKKKENPSKSVKKHLPQAFVQLKLLSSKIRQGGDNYPKELGEEG